MTLAFHHPNRKHTIGRFRLSTTRIEKPEATLTDPNTPDAAVRAAVIALKEDADPASEAWKTAIKWFARRHPPFIELQQAIDKHKNEGPKLKLAKTQIASEGVPKLKHHADGRGYPHFYNETHILKRGDVHQKQEVATQSFLQVLGSALKLSWVDETPHSYFFKLFP